MNRTNKLAQHTRNTPVRAALLAILAASKSPLTSQEMLRTLGQRHLKINKTTVYRQLEMLQKNKLVESVHFTDRVKRFELVHEHGHHHHLVCSRCRCIQDITFETDLTSQEKQIWRDHKFKVEQHILEFFGLCKACQKK